MDLYAGFAARIDALMRDLHPQLSDNQELLARAVVEPPRDPAHGDMSSNVAMVVAKPLGAKPRDIAESLVARLAAEPEIASIDVAGPGFINFRLKPDLWQGQIGLARSEGKKYGRTDIGGGEKVNVEYVSANPTGPMHVGHTRGAVFGDALASLLHFSGYDVTREYYMNDAGGQVDTLARSAFLRYREALGQEIGQIPAGLYPGDYLKPIGQMLVDKFGDDLLNLEEKDWLPKIKTMVLGAMMDLIRADLKKLDISHDVFFSEKSLHGPDGAIARTIEWLRGEGLVYEGKLPPPKGKPVEDWEDRMQTLFRAEQFGDDTDRALIKSDGSYTYFAADIAYHRDKYLRGFRHMINVLGADHSGYVKRLQAATRAVSKGEAEVDVRVCQMVRLLRGGEPVKMSKRSGELVTLAEVVDEVGADAVRFMLLFRRNDATMDFDFSLVKEQTRDNPVFYVQYAHARTCSIFRNAAQEMPELDISAGALDHADLSLVSSEEELGLVRLLAQWPRQVVLAAKAHEPHRIAFYLHELASELHAFWAKGKENPQLRFVNHGQASLTLARLSLVDAVRQVLSNGLEILGVSAPEELS